MQHERAQELLSDYLEDELEPVDREDFTAHVATCEGCRRDLESLRLTMSTLMRLRPVDPPPNFLDQVRQKIRRRGTSPFDLSLGLDRKLPFEAVSLVLICILLALYLLLVVLPTEQLVQSTRPGKSKLIRPDGGVPDPDAAPPRMKPR